MVQDMRHRGMMFVVIPKDLCEKSGVTKIVGSAQSGVPVRLELLRGFCAC